MNKKKTLWIFGIILVVFIFERILSSSVFAEKLELKAYDFMEKIAQISTFNKMPADKKIVIVAVDDASEKILKNNPDLGLWPWPKDAWSNIINIIEGGHPKAILFNLVFDRMDNNHWNDLRLAQVLRRYDNIVLGTYLYDKPLFEPETESIKTNFLPTHNPLIVRIDNKKLDNAITFHANSPIPDIYAQYNDIGVANNVVDRDFAVRKTRPIYKLVKDNKTYYMPSIAFAGFIKYLGDKEDIVIKDNKILYKKRIIPIDNNGLVYINKPGWGSQYPYTFVSELLSIKNNQKTAASNFFKDKIVIIQRNAAWKNPYSMSINTSYAPYIDNSIAVALDNFINDTNTAHPRKFISKIPVILEYLLIILTCAAVLFFGFISKTSIIGLINDLLAILVYILFSIWIFANPQSRVWIPTVAPIYYLLVTSVIVFGYKFRKEFIKRAWARKIFDKHVCPKVLSRLLQDPDAISLKSQKKYITVMSCNINNFASLAQKHNPESFVIDLNNLFAEIVNIIFNNNGTVDNITQGTITAYWGEPVKCENDAYLAVKSALEIKKKVNDLKILNTKENKMVFDVTIGINSSEALVGLTGAHKLVDYSIMGTCIEIAQRLEQSCTTLKRDILITKSTQQQAKDNIIAIEVGKLTIKGHEGQVEVFEPIEIK